jgi:hypothetical protein
MGEIFVGIEKITPLLVRCTAYEQLYLGRVPKVTNHESLEETLTTLYATVLEFLAGAKRYFAKSLAGEFQWLVRYESGSSHFSWHALEFVGRFRQEDVARSY